MMHRKIFSLYILILGLACLIVSTLSAQEVTQRIPEKTRLLFLLDGSASMYGEWEKTLKIRAAKGLLNDLVDSLRVNKNVELALRIYGHQHTPEERNCEDTRLEVPFGPSTHDQIIEKIRDLEPKGTTPIAYSLLQAAGDYPVSSDYRNIIIIITDGVESCGGDPCAVSIALQKKGIFLKPFVIGLNMDKDYQNQFGCTGTYFDARHIRDFRQALNVALQQSLLKTTVTVELTDNQNLPNETNINVSFINSVTGDPVYEFVHYRDKKGITDTLEIEPVITYNILVNTIPPVFRNEVEITGGRHNEIRIPAPQGKLRIELPNAGMYQNGVKALLKFKDTKNVFHTQDVPGTEKYLTGTYDAEVLTLPKTIFKGIQISHKETAKLILPAPGLVNLVSSSFIYGTIYEIDKEGKEKWVINLDTKNTTTKLTMQPGNYKIAYRTKVTFGSKYTAIKYFEIKSKESTSLKLFN